MKDLEWPPSSCNTAALLSRSRGASEGERDGGQSLIPIGYLIGFLCRQTQQQQQQQLKGMTSISRYTLVCGLQGTYIYIRSLSPIGERDSRFALFSFLLRLVYVCVCVCLFYKSIILLYSDVPCLFEQAASLYIRLRAMESLQSSRVALCIFSNREQKIINTKNLFFIASYPQKICCKFRRD